MTLPLGLTDFRLRGNSVTVTGTTACTWTTYAIHTLSYVNQSGNPIDAITFPGGAQWVRATATGSGAGQYIEFDLYLSSFINYYWRASFIGDTGVWSWDLNQATWAYRTGVFDNYMRIGYFGTIAKPFTWNVEAYCVNSGGDNPPPVENTNMMLPEWN